jgi:hypothetical protein
MTGEPDNPSAREDTLGPPTVTRIFFMVPGGIWLALGLMWYVIDLSDDSSSYWPMLGTGIAWP